MPPTYRIDQPAPVAGAGVDRTDDRSVTTGDQPTARNHRTVGATCRTHRGCKGFCNLRMTKVNDEIMLDPHVTGCCVISLDESEARAVRDTLTEWLG